MSLNNNKNVTNSSDVGSTKVRVKLQLAKEMPIACIYMSLDGGLKSSVATVTSIQSAVNMFGQFEI